MLIAVKPNNYRQAQPYNHHLRCFATLKFSAKPNPADRGADAPLAAGTPRRSATSSPSTLKGPSIRVFGRKSGDCL